MSNLITFILVGLGTGGIYAALASGLVVTYKGTGVINFAARAMGVWSAYVFDETRRSGDLFLPVPVNHRSQLGAEGYGGPALLLYAFVSGVAFAGLVWFLLARPYLRRHPLRSRLALGLAVGGTIPWTIFVARALADRGVYYLPILPSRIHIGVTGLLPAFLISLASAALVGLSVHLLVVHDLIAGHGNVTAVRSLHLHVDEGEVVALLGANGAGKSTTLWTLGGVLPPIAGDVEVLGRTIRGLRPHEVARRGVALVPEHRGLFHHLTAAENLRLRTRRRSRIRLEEVLWYFPALTGLLGRQCGLLSGGEQQMLAVGCALLTDPKLLLLDEMSMGLAPIVVERLLPIVRQVAKERGMGVLLVEQHVRAALDVADRGYVLSHGDVVLEGSAADLGAHAELLEASYLGGDVENIVTSPTP